MDITSGFSFITGALVVDSFFKGMGHKSYIGGFSSTTASCRSALSAICFQLRREYLCRINFGAR